jgi:hypothetical protein
LWIGEWGTVDLLVDPYTNADSGQVRVVIFISWISPCAMRRVSRRSVTL